MDEDDFPEAEPLSPAPPHTKVQRPKRRWRKWGIIIILLLLIGGGVVYWLVLKPKPKSAPASTAQNSPSSTAPTGPTQPEGDTTPTVYTSSKLALSFTHPASWKVSEDATGITIKSPSFTYQTNGKSTDGIFRMIIEKGLTSDSDEYKTIAATTAVANSDNIKYDSPTPAQHVFTNVSYLGNKADSFNFFLVTGQQTYTKGQQVLSSFQTGSDAYVIAGGYGQGDGLTFDNIPIAEFNQTQPPLSQAIAIVKSLKLS